MIKNERQYRITKAQVAEFDTTLTQFEREDTSSLHALLRQAQLEALRSQRADLQSAVEEYEELRQHRPTVIEAGSLDELPRALIRARIALGLSQKELAEKVGLRVGAREGLVVVVPAGLRRERVQQLVSGKADWIAARLAEFDTVRHLIHPPAGARPQAFDLPALAETWRVEYREMRRPTVGATTDQPGRIVVYG